MSKIKIGNFELIEITDKKKGLRIEDLESRKARREQEKDQKRATKVQREEELPQIEYRENLYNLSFGGLKDQSPFRFYQEEYDAYLTANPTDIFGDLSDVTGIPYNQLRDSIREELENRSNEYANLRDLIREKNKIQFDLSLFELGKKIGFDLSQGVDRTNVASLYANNAISEIGAGLVETAVLTSKDVETIWGASETDDIDETVYSEELINTARKARDKYNATLAEFDEKGGTGDLSERFAEWNKNLDEPGTTEDVIEAEITKALASISDDISKSLQDYLEIPHPFNSKYVADEISVLGSQIVSLEEEGLEISATIERRQFKQDERTFNQDVLTENLETEGERKFTDALINIPFAEDVYAATAANEISGERLKPAILKAVSEGRFWIRVSYLTKQEVYAFLQRGYRIIETADGNKKDGKSDENPDNDYIVSWQVTDLHNGSDERVADNWGIKLPEAYWGSKS